MKNGLVIPCYNEAKRIDIQAFESYVKNQIKVDICFVNDGSSDDTLTILQAFAERFPEKVEVYDMPKNSGKAEAVRQGVKHMLKKEKYESVGFIDADLSTSLNEYMHLVERYEEGQGSSSMILGSREMTGDNNIEQSPIRKIISTVTRFCIRIILGLPIKDTQCGAKIFEANTARLCFSRSFLTRWLFDVEMLLRLKQEKGRKTAMSLIKEVPLKEWNHVDGSKISVRDSLQIPFQLLQISSAYYLRPQLTSSLRIASAVMITLFTFLRA